jgi:hypothetical protein
MTPKLSLAETTARVEANANGNRVSIPSIKARIAKVEFSRPFEKTTLTLCVITMINGFTFVGKSACADPANFDAEVGERYAYEDAFEQIWPCEAYLIRERMWNEEKI